MFFSDFQKLEREARICRKLQHPNIGKFDFVNSIDRYPRLTPLNSLAHCSLP